MGAFVTKSIAPLRFLQWNVGSNINDLLFRKGVAEEFKNLDNEKCLERFKQTLDHTDSRLIEAAKSGAFDVGFFQEISIVIDENGERKSQTHPQLFEELEKLGFKFYFMTINRSDNPAGTGTAIVLRTSLFSEIKEYHLKTSIGRDTSIVTGVHKDSGLPFVFVSLLLAGFNLSSPDLKDNNPFSTKDGDDEARDVLEALEDCKDAITIIGSDTNTDTRVYPARLKLFTDQGFQLFTSTQYTAYKADDPNKPDYRARYIDRLMIRYPESVNLEKLKFEIVEDTEKVLQWNHRQMFENSSDHEPLMGELYFN